MKMEFAPEGNMLRVVLAGSMYLEQAEQFRARIAEIAKDASWKDAVVDLSGLVYIDSSGLGALLSLRKRAAERDGAVTVQGLSGVVREVFELTQFSRIFNVPQP